jgi:hypothetical protein
MFVQLFKDALNEYAYAAELAGMRWELNNTKYGMIVSTPVATNAVKVQYRDGKKSHILIPTPSISHLNLYNSSRFLIYIFFSSVVKPFCLQKMLTVIIFVSDICFGQVDMGQKELESCTAIEKVGSLGAIISIIHGSSLHSHSMRIQTNSH